LESGELEDEVEDVSLELDLLSELLDAPSVSAGLLSLVEEVSLLPFSTGGLGRP
jgi:hypothetical protein|tara:strand:+ start:959 stop:1120 length:162 start_codon:yes stop_codon:yes gene_type:complete